MIFIQYVFLPTLINALIQHKSLECFDLNCSVFIQKLKKALSTSVDDLWERWKFMTKNNRVPGPVHSDFRPDSLKSRKKFSKSSWTIAWKSFNTFIYWILWVAELIEFLAKNSFWKELWVVAYSWLNFSKSFVTNED